MEFFNKYKILILRSIGSLMLIVGFVVHFWVTPKEGLTANDIAAANVARMEAKVAGGSSNPKHSTKKDDSRFLKKMNDTQDKQLKYLTIIVMVFGFGSLGYSFIKKEEPKV